VIRILIADDHPLLRIGVRDLLSGEPDFEIVGEAASGREAVELAEMLRPDVVIMDLTMPLVGGATVTRSFATGLEAIAAIKALSGRAPASVVLSVHGDASIVRSALRLGASGYVLKESVSTDLVLAIKAAGTGSLFLSSEVSAVLSAADASAAETAAKLSPREKEVVQLVVDGLSTKQIASRLQTSPKTVEKQRRNAMQKLGAPNVASLVRHFSNEGQ
jgi:DNA-binding NarL/FixJ family response regulator